MAPPKWKRFDQRERVTALCARFPVYPQGQRVDRHNKDRLRRPTCAARSADSEDTQVKDSRPTEDSRRRSAGAGSASLQLRRALHHLRARAVARADRDQEGTASASRSTATSWRARCRYRCASARSRGAGRARHQLHRPPARKRQARSEDSQRGDRRTGDGDAGDQLDRRRLCPLRLGLSQFPRGEGLRRIHRPSRQRARLRPKL
jgi:hypothetical protein